MNNFLKKFKEWIGIKEMVDSSKLNLHFSERDVWMCYFGENVGFGSSGKNVFFHRPVIVIHKFGKNTFYGIPLSTQLKSNKYYVEIEFNKSKQSAMISQMRILYVRRLHYRKGRISKKDFLKVKKDFLALFQKITPPERGAPKWRFILIV